MLTFLLLIDTISMGDNMELKYDEMGKRISARRKQLRMKQNVLAELIGVSNNHLSSIECGKEKPSLDLFVEICNSLEITPDYLLMGSMHSGNVPQNIVDNLRLCSQNDIEIIRVLVQEMVKRGSTKWNNDNFA